MGLFDFWKTPCDACGQRFSRAELSEMEGGGVWCAGCSAKAAAKAAEVEARRVAEEEARAAFEARKQFGPRS